MKRVGELSREAHYDICVLTGDYRAETWGPYDATLAGVARLKAPVYGVLGNHDTICMVPGLEAMGIKMLLNEGEVIERGGQHLHLGGIDDAHFYRMDDIGKVAAAIPDGEFSILISHTPEVYQQAALAGFNLLLSGHTHGGQICLPGGIPITLDSVLPRFMGSGAWKYGNLIGYTSVGAGSSIVPVRFNCPPEITLHHLRRLVVRQCGSSRRFNLKSTGDRMSAATTKIVVPATTSRTLSGSSKLLAKRGKKDSGM
jgi:uncharacterized protein